MLTHLLSGLIGALIGGAVTGFSTYWAVNKARENAIALEERKQKSLVTAFLQAMHEEIEHLWNQYYIGAGQQLEALQPGQPFHSYYPVTQEYFTVYVGNASLIGHIEDPNLRKLIVQMYSVARGLIDCYRMNNELVKNYDYWMNLYKITKVPDYQQNALGILQQLCNYAPSLRVFHDATKKLKEQLLSQLPK